MTTYLTTYRSGAHGDKSDRERVLTTFVYQKGLNGVEMPRKCKIPNVYTLHLICAALSISLSDFFDFDDTVIKLRGKEALLVKIYRKLSPMSQDTLIKVAKCMK